MLNQGPSHRSFIVNLLFIYLAATGVGKDAVAAETLSGAPEPARGQGASESMVYAQDLKSGHKILEPFKENFDKCTNKTGLGRCKFKNMGIDGDDAHKARASCHNSGEAIDVGDLECDASRYDASSEKFFEVAKCMAHDTEKKLEVIFHKAEGENMKVVPGHEKHMHIQLKNCNMVTGK
jgi:hypothetical protein